MMEFLHFIFNGANAVPTALLLFVILYWIIVIMGFLGTDFLDFDLDFEADLDVDADVEADVSGSSSADISWINNVLIFFNLGKVPLMIWMSFLVLPLWLITVNINALFGISNFFLGMAVFLPVLFGCLFIAKVLTWPFVKFFQNIDKDSKKKEIVGKVGLVTLAADDKSKGQAEVNYSGSHLRFYIKTRTEVKVSKGDEVLFIQMLPDEEGVYLVEPYHQIK